MSDSMSNPSASSVTSKDSPLVNEASEATRAPPIPLSGKQVNLAIRSTPNTSTNTISSASTSPTLHNREIQPPGNNPATRRLSSSSSVSFNPSRSSSRRTSLIQAGAVPINAPSGGDTMSSSFSSASGFAPGSVGSEVGVGPGPGPQRYPRPRTAADLHFEMEQEQEAVVNRLTRELLRAHAQTNANQASSPSASSSAVVEDPPLTPASTGANNTSATSYFYYHSTHPRHHRTSSTTSTTNATAGNLSRQGSMRSIRSINTGRNSPAVGDTLFPSVGVGASALSPPLASGSATGWGFPPYATYGYQQTISAAGSGENLPLPGLPNTTSGDSASPQLPPPPHHPILPGSTRGTSSLAEALQWKAAMDTAQKENDALRKKVKDLEKQLKGMGDVEPEGWGGSATSGRSRSPSRIRGRTRDSRDGKEKVKDGWEGDDAAAMRATHRGAKKIATEIVRAATEAEEKEEEEEKEKRRDNYVEEAKEVEDAALPGGGVSLRST